MLVSPVCSFCENSTSCVPLHARRFNIPGETQTDREAPTPGLPTLAPPSRGARKVF